VAAVIEAERGKTGAAGAFKMIADAGFDIEGTPYVPFIARYFSGS
jgi:hypothetical protein